MWRKVRLDSEVFLGDVFFPFDSWNLAVLFAIDKVLGNWYNLTKAIGFAFLVLL